MRIAVKIAYLGKNFCGSQIQPGKKTVAGDILSDITEIQGELDADLKLAGRTDKGVNALGNVAVLSSTMEPKRLLKALNAVSKDVFYCSFAVVNDDFNPRHANERVYRYTLKEKGLNVNVLKECAALFTGEHDFRSFCKKDERSTVVDMRSVTVLERNGRVAIEFRADHFLWNLIRRIVSAMTAAASGRTSADNIKDALNGKNVSFGLAPPEPLTLIDVIYDGIEFTDMQCSHDRIEDRTFSLSLEVDFYDELNR